MRLLLTAGLLLALAAPLAHAQSTAASLPADLEFPRLDASPMDMAHFNADGEGEPEVTVVYSRPYKKDREIFGGLVPYGEVWRTGANEATLIQLKQDTMLGDERVPAGTYQLFTIPHEDRWTVVINRAVGQWGAYGYDESDDLVRFDVPVARLDTPQENLSIAFAKADDGAVMVMAWDTTAAVVPVRF